jgi:hypothetical protein
VRSTCSRTSLSVISPVIMRRRRLTVLVGLPLTDVGNLGAHLEHDALDAVPDRKSATRRECELEGNDKH